MEIRTVHDMDKCFLVLEDTEYYEMGYQQKMLLHHEVNGLLKVEKRQINNVSCFYYNITDRISAREYFTGSDITSDKLKYFYEKIIDTVISAKDYFLKQDNFLIQIDYIFVSDGENLDFCFYENYETPIREQMIKLTEYFMEEIDYHNELAVTNIYKIYKLLKEEQCSFTKLKAELNGIMAGYQLEDNRSNEEPPIGEEIGLYPDINMGERDVVNKLSKSSSGLICLMVDAVILIITYCSNCLYYKNVDQISWKSVLIVLVLTFIIDYNIFYLLDKRRKNIKVQECVFEDSSETVLLTDQRSYYLLKSEGGKDQFILTKFPFIIGADGTQVTGVLAIPGISKKHAEVVVNRDVYYIRDLNSTNGTFLNGWRLEVDKKYKLKNQDRIAFGNVTFQFIKLS